MPDLAEQIRTYVDGLAEPVTLDEARRARPRPRRRVAWLAAAAVVLVVVTVAGVAVAVHPGGGRDEQVEAGPAGQPKGWAWLAPFGTETPAPTVPAGWQTLDVGDLRFSVPGDWTVPAGECSPAAHGWVEVIVRGAQVSLTCLPVRPPGGPVLTVRLGTAGGAAGTPVRVGALPAVRVAPRCGGCPPVYRFAGGDEVTVTGPDAARVLGTFTDAGARRVLQLGPGADTRHWRTVAYDGLALDVPARWQVVDIPASYHEGGGSVTQAMEPGACGTALFGADRPPGIFLGRGRMFPTCRAGLARDLAARDGAWIRTVDAAEVARLGPPVARGLVAGLDVSVLRTQYPAGPALDLLVRRGGGTIRISLGVGPDARTARAILHSLRPA